MSGTAAVCPADSHVSVTHDPDSDTPVIQKKLNISAPIDAPLHGKPFKCFLFYQQ